MVGASNWRILRRHLLPHLAPILLVWGAVAAGTNILAEVGLSFLGIGVQASTPSLGSLLSEIWGTIYNAVPYNSRPAHAVADGVPDGVDRHHRRLAQPPLGRHPPRDRTERHAAVRAARYLLGRLARGVLTLLLMIAITFALYFAIERQPPVNFFFPRGRARHAGDPARRSRW